MSLILTKNVWVKFETSMKDWKLKKLWKNLAVASVSNKTQVSIGVGCKYNTNFNYTGLGTRWKIVGINLF